MATKKPPPIIEADEVIEPSAGALVPRAREAAIGPVIPRPRQPELLEAWLTGRSPETVRAYKKDLAHFAEHLGITIEQTLKAFLTWSPGDANLYVLDFRNKMVERKLAPATINRRLASLRSLAKVGRLSGKIVWSIDVDNVDAEAYRDTQGPGVDALKKMLKATQGTTFEVRNRAILTMLYAMALRRGELAALHLEHVDLTKNRVSIIGKGRAQREWLDMPPVVVETLKAWIAERGDAPGSLFDVTGGGVYYIVTSTAERAGVGHVRPHGVRHTAITTVLDKTNGNHRTAASFARHKDIKVTQRYDDNRRNDYGKAATVLGADLEET